MRKLLASCALLGLVATPVQAQDAPRVFTQNGSWSLDYGDDYCRLAANFTNGNDRIALAMERIQPGNEVRLALVGNAIKLFRRADQIGLQFLPAGTERKLPYVLSEVGGEQYLLIGHVRFEASDSMAPGAPPAPPPYDRAAERALGKAVTGFALGSGLVAPVEVRSGSLAAPMQALQDCTDDMLNSWGLDAARHKTLSKPAMPVYESLLPAQKTVPFGDFPKFGGGMNQFRMMLDADGKPTDCKVHFPSLDAAKNQQLCSLLLAEGRFTPALDASGQPMASYAILAFGFARSQIRSR